MDYEVCDSKKLESKLFYRTSFRVPFLASSENIHVDFCALKLIILIAMLPSCELTRRSHEEAMSHDIKISATSDS